MNEMNEMKRKLFELKVMKVDGSTILGTTRVLIVLSRSNKKKYNRGVSLLPTSFHNEIYIERQLRTSKRLIIG